MATSVFGRRSNGIFEKDSSVYSLFHGTNAMLLEDELNETQWNIIENIAETLRVQYNSGILSSYNINATGAQSEFYIESTKPLQALINGYFLKFGNNNVSGAITTPNDNRVVFKLNPSGTSDRTDLIILEAWFETISYFDDFHKYGGEDTPLLSNNFLDNRVGKETSKRVQFRWRIRVVDDESSVTNVTAFKCDSTDSGILYTPMDSIYYASTGVQLSATSEFISNGDVFCIPLFTVNRPANNNSITLSNVIDITPKAMLSMVKDPTQPYHVATKQYVDSYVQGLDIKLSVKAATTSNITLSGTQTIDGVSLSLGDRVLVKDQTNGAENGIYIVNSGAWVRSLDADSNNDISSGMFTFIEEGTINGDNGWVLTNNGTINLGTTPLTFVQFSGAGQIITGTGLTKNGNTLSLTSGIVNPGTYKSITVDTYGRVTSGSNPTTVDGYGIIDALKNTGGIMTGNITFTDDAEGVEWSRNTDGASIKFYNTADTDTDSRLEFNVRDNGDEYFRWTNTQSGTTTELMKLLPVSGNLSVKGIVTAPTFSGTLSGNAATASKLQTARTISLTGDVTGSVSFDGSGNASIATTYKNSGVSAGTYTKVVVDAKGSVTSGTTLATSDIPSLDWSKITTGKPNTVAGYGIINAALADSFLGALDLNNLVTPGIWNVQDTVGNRPTNSWGTVIVGYISHSLWIQQLWLGQNNDMYMRRSWDISGTRVWGSWTKILKTGETPNIDGSFDYSTTSPTGTTRLNYSGYFYATKVYNAVYNDYAEYFLKGEEIEPGDIVKKDLNTNTYIKSNQAYDKAVVGVLSDDYAQCIGGEKDLSLEKQEEKYAPIGLAGRARVKVSGNVEVGDLIVSSSIPGVGMTAMEYKPGTVIGKALESHNGDGINRITILILNM